jgi:hypothetical protein
MIRSRPPRRFSVPTLFFPCIHPPPILASHLFTLRADVSAAQVHEMEDLVRHTPRGWKIHCVYRLRSARRDMKSRMVFCNLKGEQGGGVNPGDRNNVKYHLPFADLGLFVCVAERKDEIFGSGSFLQPISVSYNCLRHRTALAAYGMIGKGVPPG